MAIPMGQVSGRNGSEMVVTTMDFLKGHLSRPRGLLVTGSRLLGSQAHERGRVLAGERRQALHGASFSSNPTPYTSSLYVSGDLTSGWDALRA